MTSIPLRFDSSCGNKQVRASPSVIGWPILSGSQDPTSFVGDSGAEKSAPVTKETRIPSRATIVGITEAIASGLHSSDQVEKADDERRRAFESAALTLVRTRLRCTPEPKLTFGNAQEQILTIVTAELVDLIVMGVRRRTPVDLMLFGLTTNQVVRRVSCPVLTLRN